MTTALLSIHPHHVDAILAGRKTVEIRRVVPSRDVTRLLIYETAPTSSIVADCAVRTWIDAPNRLLRRFGSGIGVTRAEFRSYVGDRERICMLEIEDIRQVLGPTLADYGLRWPPQSWAYVEHR